MREGRELRGLRDNLSGAARLVVLHLKNIDLWRTTPDRDVRARMVFTRTCASSTITKSESAGRRCSVKALLTTHVAPGATKDRSCTSISTCRSGVPQGVRYRWHMFDWGMFRRRIRCI